MGQSYVPVLAAALARSRKIVPVYSRRYFDKGMCQWELTKSIQLDPVGAERKLNPLLADPSAAQLVPLWVDHIHFLSVDLADWFSRLCDALELSRGAEPAVLGFLGRPPGEILVNHTLPAIRVRARAAAGTRPQEQEITLAAEDGDLHGTLTLKTHDGEAEFKDLSLGKPVASTCLLATAEGCEAARSEAFAVVMPAPPPQPVVPQVEVRKAIPLRGEAIFFRSGQALAVLGPGSLSVYDLDGQPRGGAMRLLARPRVLRRAGPLLALADWSGNVYGVRDDGAHWQAPFAGPPNGMFVPGGLAISGDTVYVGFWSGAIYRLPPGAAAVEVLTHAAGVQALELAGHRLYVIGLDGTLVIYEGRDAVERHELEKTVHALYACSDSLVAVGNGSLYHLRIDQKLVLSERLPFGPVAAVFGEGDHPVALDAKGKGARFTADLVYKVRFHATPGAIPVSADDAGHFCVFRNPDGSRTLMVDDRVVFTHLAGTLAVSPAGDWFAVGDEKAIQVLDRKSFQELIEGVPRA